MSTIKYSARKFVRIWIVLTVHLGHRQWYIYFLYFILHKNVVSLKFSSVCVCVSVDKSWRIIIDSCSHKTLINVKNSESNFDFNVGYSTTAILYNHFLYRVFLALVFFQIHSHLILIYGSYERKIRGNRLQSASTTQW